MNPETRRSKRKLCVCVQCLSRPSGLACQSPSAEAGLRLDLKWNVPQLSRIAETISLPKTLLPHAEVRVSISPRQAGPYLLIKQYI